MCVQCFNAQLEKLNKFLNFIICNIRITKCQFFFYFVKCISHNNYMSGMKQSVKQIIKKF